MWCPPDFRRVHSDKRRTEKIERELYDPEIVERINRDKQTIKTNHVQMV